MASRDTSAHGAAHDRVIMLDVDGVIGAEVTRGRDQEVEVRIPDPIADRIRVLAGLARIVWATSWDAEVRRRLTARLGLPQETESLVIVPRADAIEAKRVALDRFLGMNGPDGGWRSIVWVDDGIRASELRWAAESGHPITLVRVDRTLLLTDADVAAVAAAMERS